MYIINRLPGVYFKESTSYDLPGSGGKIPIFIGKTGLTVANDDLYKVDGTHYFKFENSAQALRPPVKTGEQWKENSGIGTPSDSNQLATTIQEFFEECKLQQTDDIGVPYIYAIDVGDGTSVTAWETALETAKTLTDATVEIYVGAENITNCTLESFIYKAVDSIYEDTEDLDLRYGFVTSKQTANETLKQYDTRLIGLANSLRTHYGEDAISKLSRLGICEDLVFGKTMARICCTPHNVEPGYLVYRSVTTDNIFHKRLKEDMLDLQNAGIIFNRYEQVNGKKYPRINLCVSASFTNSQDRPADSLFHARFNADDLLREIFEVCFTQIKNNETGTNLAYLQTLIDVVVNNRVTNDEVVDYNDATEKGTKLVVQEAINEPYNLVVTGQIQPVKCTIAIRVEAKIII